jgi:2-dehydro-3-deoxygluconokinase
MQGNSGKATGAPAIACIGECMIELSQLDWDRGQAQVGFAGDTANTAIYLSRLMPGTVSYVTNLGQDAFSARMLAVFRAEGIDCRLIARHETRLPGIYSIEIDENGERSFRYWREASAARTLFSGVGAELRDLDGFDVIFLSGITLAILPPQVRAALIAHLADLKAAGKTVVFDSNYRPRLWPDPQTARDCLEAMWAACSLGLPSLDDEQALWPGAQAGDVLDRIAGHGVAEVVLKTGAAGPMIRHLGQTMQPALPRAAHVVDTTGAGDSFNAGYLAARLGGALPEAAAAAGHRLALAVIGQHGGVIARSKMPEG